MKPIISIVMGSSSDLPIMEEAAKILNDFKIPFEINILSAHRVPEKVAEFAKNAYSRGIKVIIAGAGMAAHLPGVIASFTTIPVIGVPLKSSNTIEGDSVLSILQMPPGIPVATMALNGAKNAGIFAAQILAMSDENILKILTDFRNKQKENVLKAKQEVAQIKLEYKVE